MKILVKWWNKLSPLRKLIYGYIILGVSIYLITTTFTLISSILHYPEEKYYCWDENECELGEFAINVYIVFPVILFMYMVYGFIFEPYEYVRMFDFSFEYVFMMIWFLFIISIPLMIGLYLKKIKRIKTSYVFIGLFVLILCYLLTTTVYFYLTFPNP